MRSDVPVGTTPLPGGSFHVRIGFSTFMMTRLRLSCESMPRLAQRSRRILVACGSLLLLTIVALSTATRRPCLQVRSATWHTFKASHMTASKLHPTCRLDLRSEADPLSAIRAKRPLNASTYLPHVRPARLLSSTLYHTYGLRSPPELV
jgi:hypothetical protein